MYYYYSDPADPANSPFSNCSNLYYCFMINLDNGFKQDPGVVGNENFVTFSNVLVNFSYLFVIKLLLGEIVGAIIVDKFAEIRE